MRINDSLDLGRYLADRRRALSMTQAQLAARAGVSRRWITDLEAGKASSEVGLILKAMSALGLLLDVRPEPVSGVDLDAYLNSLGETP